MRLSAARLAKGFGQLAYLRGIVQYRLSPFEQRAFAGFLNSIPKTARRMGSSAIYVVPPFALAYLWYSETEKEFKRINRKNPADFANDK